MSETEFARRPIIDLGYTFTNADWVTFNTPHWLGAVGHLRGRGLEMLEIGSYEGRSAIWWLTNLLTHPLSRITCIDLWHNPAHERHFDRNLSLLLDSEGAPDKLRKWRGRSRDLVPKIPDASLDVSYIDGSHEGHDVLLDALLVLEKVKIGGTIIFDDYEWTGAGEPPGRRHFPKPAIDAFLRLCDYRLRVVHVGYQVIVRRTV